MNIGFCQLQTKPALSTRNENVIGFDVDKRKQDGVRKLFNFLNNYDASRHVLQMARSVVLIRVKGVTKCLSQSCTNELGHEQINSFSEVLVILFILEC